MGQQVAAVPAMMAAADATERLRVGSFVLANDYRNPVMLAKEIATIDAISGGRVDLGIGAGWSQGDYREMGIGYDAPGIRVARFEESVLLLKRLFAEDRVDHTGTFYTVRGARVLPRPVQRPHPPFMIGGGGPRVLRFAAREADIVSFIPSLPRGRPRFETISSRSLADRITRFRRYAGARADEIDTNVWLLDAGIVDPARGFARATTTLAKRGMNAMLRFPFLLYGTRSSVREVLRERRERFGINYISIPGQAMDEFGPVVEELRGT